MTGRSPKSLHADEGNLGAAGRVGFHRTQTVAVAEIDPAGLSVRIVGRAILRNALSTAIGQGLVARNVAALASPPRIPEQEFRALGTADARALLAAVAGDPLEALFTVALAVGLRQGDKLRRVAVCVADYC